MNGWFMVALSDKNQIEDLSSAVADRAACRVGLFERGGVG